MAAKPSNSMDLTSTTSGLANWDGSSAMSSTGLTQFSTLTAASSNTINNVSPGTSGQVLTSNGASAQPTYQTGGVKTINGDSGSITGTTVTIYANNASKNAGASVKFANSGTTSTFDVTDASGNTYIGQSAGTASGSHNASLGFQACTAITSTSNVGVGYNALLSCTSGGTNIGIGDSAGGSITTGSQNVAVGNFAQQFNNVSNNTSVGWAALNNNSGQYNVGVGGHALHDMSGDANVAVGYFAMGFEVGSGTRNCAFGHEALQGVEGGTDNVIIGYTAMPNNTGGNFNICVGSGAGSAYVTGTESSNILIGNAGTNNESNVMRMGTNGSGSGQVSSCFIAGITGVTVTGATVLCSTAGQLGTISSSGRYKENISDMPNDVSVLNLRPVQFSYKKDKLHTRQFGLIAEEVESAFPYLCLYNDEGQPESVKYHELPVFLLKEIQKLNARIRYLEENNPKKQEE